MKKYNGTLDCLNTGDKDKLMGCDDCASYNECDKDPEHDQLKEQDRREKGEKLKRDMDNPARYSKYD